jgi:nucleoside-diphosphate-sugar epimerase
MSKMSEKRVIITGATGMVGGCALRICLENPDVSMVTVVGRNPTGIDDARLREVVVDDFTDFSALENKDIRSILYGSR